MSWLAFGRQRASALAYKRDNFQNLARAFASATKSVQVDDLSDSQADIPQEVNEDIKTSFTSLEEDDLAEMRASVKKLSFLNPEKNNQLSPEMRERLSLEFDKFLDDFVHSVDPAKREAEIVAEKVSGINFAAFGRMSQQAQGVSGDGNLSGRPSFPSLAFTEPNQPYSKAELYVRQLFHAQKVLNLGAEISSNIYKPHENLHKPSTIAETGISSLLAAGGHLGHATNRVRANCLPFIYGIREGIHIIDLQQTLAALRRVSRVVEELSRKSGLLLFVGTREGQHRTVEKAAERSKGFYVHDHWVPGTLTNYQVITDQKQRAGRIEVNMADENSGRQLSSSLHDTIIKPDLVIVLNPVENRAVLSECMKLRIPTAGIIDTDSEPSLLTYPIPGNDDSLRFTDLIAGVLSKAAERGRLARISDFRKLQALKKNLREGETTLNAPASPEKPLSDLNETEKELLKHQV